MKIVFATQNPGKIREIREILGKDGFEVVSIGDLDIRACAEERACCWNRMAAFAWK